MAPIDLDPVCADLNCCHPKAMHDQANDECQCGDCWGFMSRVPEPLSDWYLAAVRTMADTTPVPASSDLLSTIRNLLDEIDRLKQ